MKKKIYNPGDPVSDKDAVDKRFFEQEIQKFQLKPSHNTNHFEYLMKNTLEWSDLISGGNSFNMTNTADLSPDKGNFHSYNHKVIYTTVIKNSRGVPIQNGHSMFSSNKKY